MEVTIYYSVVNTETHKTISRDKKNLADLIKGLGEDFDDVNDLILAFARAIDYNPGEIKKLKEAGDIVGYETRINNKYQLIVDIYAE